MILNLRVIRALVLLTFLVISFSFPATDCYAQEIILKLRVGDTAVAGQQYSVPLPVYLSNYTDSVAGFDFKIAVDRGDLVSFHDTLIAEGSLTTNWELRTSILSGANHDTLRLIGMADLITPTKAVPAIEYPQSGDLPLLWVMLDLDQPPDSQPALASISIVTETPYDFIFSDDRGRTIGLTLDTIYDTLWYACDLYAGGECVSWVLVDGPPADSFWVDLSLKVEVDSNEVALTSGGVGLGWHLCGDLVGEEDRVNLADITFMISMVYMNGEPPLVEWSANVDGSSDGRVNLADITMLISHVYIDSVPLKCE